MIAAIGILCVICIGQALYIRYVNGQLSEWLDFLKGIKNAPEQKCFVKGKGLLADINFAINDILEENRKQFKKLINAENANKQILTNLSHDVRTPLASLTGYLEALEQDKVKEEEQKEYICIAYQKALNLKELVNYLFEWFKINANEQEYYIKEYDVNELTRQIIISYLPIVEKNQVRLKLDIPEEECLLKMDKIAYERILYNLLNNAIKHGNCSELMIKIQKNSEAVMIEISNNGMMIPKENIPFLFERLYKCDLARTQNGSGLGLAIVKELVTAMKGKISVQSLLEKTSFYITFPYV